MKCDCVADDVSPSVKTKFYSGKGGTGGEESFPQEEICAKSLDRILNIPDAASLKLKSLDSEPVNKSVSNLALQRKELRTQAGRPILKTQKFARSNVRQSKANSISKEINETIQMIQTIIQRLCWSIEEINTFIAQKFQGRRRAQLADTELIDLLYYLQTQPLEKA